MKRVSVKGVTVSVRTKGKAQWFGIHAVLEDGTRVPLQSTAQVMLLRRIVHHYEIDGAEIDRSVVVEHLKDEVGYYV